MILINEKVDESVVEFLYRRGFLSAEGQRSESVGQVVS